MLASASDWLITRDLRIMPKRIIAAMVGILAILSGCIMCWFAVEATVNSLAAPLKLFGGLVLAWTLTLAALVLGLRFVRFAWVGRSERSNPLVSSILLGIGFFFPGAVFSFPFTIIWARHLQPHNDESVPAAILMSIYVGVAAAIICSVTLLVRMRDLGKRHGPQTPRSQPMRYLLRNPLPTTYLVLR
jgi:hypothetical protein